MAATTLGFIPLQLIQTNALNHYSFDKGFPANGTYVVVKTPTVAQQLQLTKSLKDMQSGKEINNNDINNKPVILRCKRRVDFTGLGCKLVDSHNPSVSRRNERERKRVKMVNMGFETLRQHVPSGRKNKKMSKVETLRSAVQYIKQLQDMLDAGDTDVGLDGVNLDELQSKVSEMIKNSNLANNLDMDDDENSLDLDNGNSSANCDNTVDNINNINYHHQQQSTEIQQQQQLNNLHQQQQQFQQQSPEPSPGLPESPVTSQEQHFFTYHQNSQIFSSGHFVNSSSMYAQGSPVGSLHSPTSSVVSDSSYDSIGENASPDDDDIMSGISSWF